MAEGAPHSHTARGSHFIVDHVMGHGAPATAGRMQSSDLTYPCDDAPWEGETHQPYFAGGSRSGLRVRRLSGAATGLSRDAAAGYTVAESATMRRSGALNSS